MSTDTHTEHESSTPGATLPGAGLTTREREVLALVNAGRTNAQVATELGISRDAVRYHLKELHSKLETGSERGLLRRYRPPRLLGLLGLGLGAARMEVAATVALGALALGGAGAAYVAWNRTDTHAAEPGRPCQATDTGPCLLTVNSQSFARYNLTLKELARQYHTNEADLRRLNPALPDGVIVAGYDIVLPVPAGSGVAQANPTAAVQP